MAHFRKLLLAIDLSPESDLLISRVAKMYREDVDHLHVVHVIKRGLHDAPSVAADSGESGHAQRLIDHTGIRLRELLHRNGLEISSDRIYVETGEPSYEIKKLAREIAADLVIVGSHSKGNDWLQLPGTTTNCVIQGISSDVMAVKV